LAKKYFKKACSGKYAIGCYNLSCYYSRKKDKMSAFIYLEKAFRLGFNNWNHVMRDKDLQFIKMFPEFKSLIKRYKR